MNKFVSVVIPNYNGSKTIGKCLEAVLSSSYDRYEVIVVDDASSDNSVDLIMRFPCRLIRFDRHAGSSRARNAGARESTGEIIFFIDADCIVAKDTLSLVQKAFAGRDGVVVGGSYTQLPHDNSFFSAFQSVFINYSELKRKEPDYIASHAMAIEKRDFDKSGGFPEQFLPIIEDVEFSHRLRRLGYKLLMEPDILVRHIFNFTFWRSLRNAFRKSRYWTMYSLGQKDVLTDSGTASIELKVNVLSHFLIMLSFLLYAFFQAGIFIILPIPVSAFNIYLNKNLIGAFHRAKGTFFAMTASLYYFLIYPLAVGAGSLTGMVQYYKSPRQEKSRT
ncbi:MAG: glycosyltransferase [Nitrospirota bacterium]|nr:glycosyltransferase [Nitrospirota bacterium]